MKFALHQHVVRSSARQAVLVVEGHLVGSPTQIAVRSEGTQREPGGECVWENAANLRCLPEDHKWVTAGLIDTCSVCTEERA